MTELPERPWQKVSLDSSGPYASGEYCPQVVVDNYSRYPEVELVSTTSAAAVIPRLDKMFGIPAECKSDNGPPFQSREFAEYARTQEFRHQQITLLHPDAKGEAERLQKLITTTTVEGSR